MAERKQPTLAEMIEAGHVAAEFDMAGGYVAIVDVRGMPTERLLRRTVEPVRQTIHGTLTLPDGSTHAGWITTDVQPATS